MASIPPDSSKHSRPEPAIRWMPESTERVSDGSGFGSWPLLVIAFGILVALLIITGVATLNKATRLYSTLSTLNQDYRKSWQNLDEIRSGIHVSSVLVRDYLLDPSQSRGKEIREELVQLRTETEDHLSRLERFAGPSVKDMRPEIDAYWESLDPVFDWTPEEKQAAAYSFLRRQIMPRRESALALAQEVQTFTEKTFQGHRQEIRRNEQEFRSFLLTTLAGTVALGLLVAAASIIRVRRLEGRSREQRLRAERAEDEMRRLSHQLVRAQEEERRSISRELHDEVGQMLTGLRMELRSLRKVHRDSPTEFDGRIEQTRVLLEQTLQSVRDIAMGLRPSMLDDLGLEAALQWQARDFERRHEIAVTLDVRTTIDDLPERFRTNLYRIVQEALTNAARHARAKNVRIGIEREEHAALRLWVEDDGIGISERAGAGLGLVGIHERARELGGAFRVDTGTGGKGTRIAVELPEEAVLHG